MKLAEFVATVQSRRQKWDALMEEVSEQRMTLPVLPGGWTVKDVIAHISWYENEMVDLIQTKALRGSELWLLPTDERNQSIYVMNRSRPLEEVLQESHRIFSQLEGLIETLEEADLIDASRYADMPPDWPPLEVLAGNTYEHYDEHIADVRNWLSQLE